MKKDDIFAEIGFRALKDEKNGTQKFRDKSALDSQIKSYFHLIDDVEFLGIIRELINSDQWYNHELKCIKKIHEFIEYYLIIKKKIQTDGK